MNVAINTIGSITAGEVCDLSFPLVDAGDKEVIKWNDNTKVNVSITHESANIKWKAIKPVNTYYDKDAKNFTIVTGTGDEVARTKIEAAKD